MLESSSLGSGRKGLVGTFGGGGGGEIVERVGRRELAKGRSRRRVKAGRCGWKGREKGRCGREKAERDMVDDASWELYGRSAF